MGTDKFRQIKPIAITTLVTLIFVGYLAGLQAQSLDSTSQPTRIPSIFDAPSDTGASEQPAAQPTRIPSIFDAPPDTGASDQPAAQPTRVPSIFDAPSTTGDSEQPTRVPSLFDSPASDEPAEQPQTAPYTSVFDAIQGSEIRFEGDEPPDKDYCLDCHANPYLQMVLPSGETLSVAVDEEEYMASVHGQHGTEGYRCIRCHEGMNEYPHQEVTASTARELVVDYSTSCARCHTDKYNETLDGVHLEILASGNKDAAVCADCHTGHAIQSLNDERSGEPLPGSHIASAEMCTDCHTEVYDHYASSIHGSALLEGNTDVPTCVDCHGVHDTEGPSNDTFRLFSPQTCAECHADEQLMAKYDIRTDVFDTYVSDFHGTTVMIFQKTAPDQGVNAPVCVDCHGVHEIMAVDDATSPVLQDNLLTTCQRCHPDASSDFPAAWMGHYPPSFDRTPVVALADTIYAILIPTMIGGLGLFVLTDIYRRWSNSRKER